MNGLSVKVRQQRRKSETFVLQSDVLRVVAEKEKPGSDEGAATDHNRNNPVSRGYSGQRHGRMPEQKNPRPTDGRPLLFRSGSRIES